VVSGTDSTRLKLVNTPCSAIRGGDVLQRRQRDAGERAADAQAPPAERGELFVVRQESPYQDR
jgi:hypothetical protein